MGDWFVFDYNALDIGDCNVVFYDYDMCPSLVEILPFTHVPTRDFDDSGEVDFADFAKIASYWQQPCEDPDWCDGADLDSMGSVDINDIMLFFDYWLEKTR